MIGRLIGEIVEEFPDGSVVLDVGGVGYEVHMPLGLAGRLRGSERATVYVHTHVREDAFTLYGFAAADDRAAFRALLTVTGVGPKLALAVLSALDAHTLALAIERGDKAAFRGISGVGKKTVEHLLLDLKGKLQLTGAPSRPHASHRPVASAPHAEVVVALLCNLGFKRMEAEAAVLALPEEQLREAPVDTLLREALARLR